MDQPVSVPPPPAPAAGAEGPVIQVVKVHLREFGSTETFNCNGLECRKGAICVVEAERGIDYGMVVSAPESIVTRKTAEAIRKVIRQATPNDLLRIKSNANNEKRARDACTRLVGKHQLEMKVLRAEFSFDCSKIVFYFTAEKRVDFRALAKDLASELKARIELRQIGVRDQAKVIGGIGCCGRKLCCAAFLDTFSTINIKMAKVQRLSLNPSKISGQCGRLLCCLKYEFQVYKQLCRNMPKEDTVIETEWGRGKIIDLNIIKQTVIVQLEGGKQVEFPVVNGEIVKIPRAQTKHVHS